jgi:3-deoxy-D-manno-octulosonic-acid transferase
VIHFLYTIVISTGFVLALPYFLWKGRSTGKYLQTFRERMGRLPVYLNVDGDRSIWIHAVSVGEVLAARTLVKPLRERFPRHRLYLSTTTLTGNAVARKSVRGIDGLFYAPFDFPGPVRAALSTLNPELLLLVETEIWPNLIHEARRRGTRVALVNGRISPRSFPRYRAIRPLLRPVLAEIDAFLMQGEPHARRVIEMGAPPDRVRALGNLKFDAVGETRTRERVARLFQGAGERPLWVAGSTVEGEEPLILQAYHRVRERVPHARLVLAPRHPERFDQIPPLVEAAGFRCQRRSQLDPGHWREGEVLLLDTLGELAQVYPLATVVFVGGSLVPAGGHNVLEPAVAGRAVVVGPHMENFQEIADEFLAEGALVQVRSSDELSGEVLALLADEKRRALLGERGRAIVERNRGARERTAEALVGLLA